MTTTVPSPVATDVRLIAIGRSEAGQPVTVVSDPAFVRWQAEGASTCGATWSDKELAALPIIERCREDEPLPLCYECGQMIEGWAHPDGFGNYHCDKCGPTCDHNEKDVRWCECTDQVGSGPCPVCGGELFPF